MCIGSPFGAWLSESELGSAFWPFGVLWPWDPEGCSTIVRSVAGHRGLPKGSGSSRYSCNEELAYSPFVGTRLRFTGGLGFGIGLVCENPMPEPLETKNT